MPSKICSMCETKKNISEFQRDSRNRGGCESRCKECKNNDRLTKVKCPHCGVKYHKCHLAKHMRTRKCIDYFAKKEPWEKFKSNGKKTVKCPCKHKKCLITIKESMAYSHLRYGLGYVSPAAIKRKKAIRKARLQAERAREMAEEDGEERNPVYGYKPVRAASRL